MSNRELLRNLLPVFGFIAFVLLVVIFLPWLVLTLTSDVNWRAR